MFNAGDKGYQMDLFYGLRGMDERHINWLFNSWAFGFRLWVYPLIDGEMFRPLYSVVPSRPSSPTNTLASLLIIQSMFGWSDDEVHNQMMSGNIALHFAVNYLGQDPVKVPTCDKALTRFRKRIAEYKEETGIDLLKQLYDSVTYGLAALSGVTAFNTRMDSAMINANIRRYTREGLFFVCIQNVVSDSADFNADFGKFLNENGLSKYFEDSAYNRFIYYSHSSKTEKDKELLEDVDKLFSLVDDFQKTHPVLNINAIKELPSWKNLNRVLDEQTVIEKGSRRMATSEDGCMNSTILQNPVDPDATFRVKASKEYIGYVLNLLEGVGPFGSLILAADFEQNVQSDVRLATMALDQADAILSGIEAYNKALGIENPGDMQKCREILAEKTELVQNAIRESLRKKVPFTSGFYATEDGGQISFDEYEADIMSLLNENIPVPDVSSSQNTESAESTTEDSTVQPSDNTEASKGTGNEKVEEVAKAVEDAASKGAGKNYQEYFQGPQAPAASNRWSQGEGPEYGQKETIVLLRHNPRLALD